MAGRLPQEVVEELQHRYAQIGLARDTWCGGAAPDEVDDDAGSSAGDRRLGGESVYVGMRNWHPYIADVIAQMRTDGVTQYQGSVPGAAELADQRWAVSACGAGGRGGDRGGVCCRLGGESDCWHRRLRRSCGQCGRRLAQSRDGRCPVLFTAHSVPCRTIMTGEASVAGARPGTPMQTSPDPYPVEAKRTAQMVAERMAAVGLRRDRTGSLRFRARGSVVGRGLGRQ